ncbi:MAG: TRAP transporter substrate-binding protein DctP [Castellaniella sp.]
MKKQWLMASLLAGILGMGTAHAQATKPVELTFSTYLPPAYEYIYKPAENFLKAVEAESNGRIKVNIFHSGQLFGGYDELAALSRGDIDITNMTGTYPGGTVPALNIFTMPFMFDDVPHLQRALDEGLMDLGINKELFEDHNTVVLGVAPLDPYEFYSRNTPILTADDFKGKVWASTGASDARALQLLGGSPTMMASGDLYLSFDRGVIDGTPRPLITGIGRSLYEVSKYLSLATFAFDTSILSMNRDKWEALPEDIQAIFREQAKKRDAEQFERVSRYVEEALAKFEAEGMQIDRITPENLQAMRDITAPAVEEWSKEVPNAQAYLDLIARTKAP